MAKRALVIGINAYDPPNTLPSCINDADSISDLLANRYGFADITNLRDRQATKAGITNGLQALLAGAQSGDTLVFYFSGHGYSYQDGTDWIEALVPQDAKFLTSDEMGALTAGAPAGVLTCIMDSCFSGGMQKAFAQQGGIRPAIVKFWTLSAVEQPKAFAPELHAIDTCRCFGEAPLPIFRTPFAAPPPVGFKDFSLVVPPTAGVERDFILLSACKADETAAASTDLTNGRSAFTFSLLDQIAQNAGKRSVAALMDSVGQELRQLGVRQTPMLKVPSAPAFLEEHALLDWNGPIQSGSASLPSLVSFSPKGFVMPQTSSKDWLSDVANIVQNVTPLVAAALKDFQPPAKGFDPSANGSTDKDFFDDLTRTVATLVPAIVQGLGNFQPPSKGFATGSPEPFDKGWFDNVTSIAAAVVPEVISALKTYPNPSGNLGRLASAAQKGWFDDVTHVVASVLPAVIAATKDIRVPGAASSKDFQPTGADDKGWQDILGTIGQVAQVAVPIALSIL